MAEKKKTYQLFTSNAIECLRLDAYTKKNYFIASARLTTLKGIVVKRKAFSSRALISNVYSHIIIFDH